MRTSRRSCIPTLPARSTEGRAALLVLLGAVAILAAAASLRFGSQSFSLGELIGSLFEDGQDTVQRILLYVRLPRTVAGAAAGAALAMAGALIQAVLNNAMASPNVIGVNAGAGFAAMLVAGAFPAAAALVPAAAFFGALATTLFIYLLAMRAGLSRTTLILAGVAVSSMLSAGIDALTLLFPDDAVGATGFLLGGFSGVTLDGVAAAGWYLAAGALLALLLASDLNLLALGEETAASLGLAVGRVRFLAILAAALLAGGTVSFAGLLGFVGLLVPHIVRRLVGTDNRWLLPASALAGAGFVLLCDVAARLLFAPFELPVGIVMSLLGGPFFLGLLLRRGRGRVYD